MPRRNIFKESLLGIKALETLVIGGVIIAFQLPQTVIASSSGLAISSSSEAQQLNKEGLRQLEVGNPETALEIWEQAEAVYTMSGDEVGKLGSQLNQVQALQALGQYRRAKKLLERINAQLQSLSDSPLRASSLQSLGIVLFRVGNLQESKQILLQSLKISQSLGLDSSGTLLALGNVTRVQENDTKASKSNTEEAIAFYQQAIAKAPDKLTQLQANLNLLSLLVEVDQSAQASSLVLTIQTLLKDLSPSRAAVYAQVNFSESLIKMRSRQSSNSFEIPNSVAIAQILTNAVQQARSLDDFRAEAYAIGQLGYLYEASGQWPEAKQLTNQALQIAQSIQADDLTVLWQWQVGRILRQQGQTLAAISAYSQAVEALSRLRGDLVAINPEAQFSFREQVEPVYRELVQLLLEDNPTQEDLKKARATIEALQIAELNNFFRESCLDAKPQPIDYIDPNAAVVYSIVLPDRIAIILSIPNQLLEYRFTKLTLNSPNSLSNKRQVSEVEQVFDDLFATLNPFITTQNPLPPRQQLYNWLIRPIEAKLSQSQVKTLVFILDGVLQGIPLATLHDGKQYLIERYSIALTPGLQILPPGWKKRTAEETLTSAQLETLVAGLSEARHGFSALPGVDQEVKQISSIVPTKILLNQTFTQIQLATKLESQSFPIVHFATHGEFSSRAEDTFLLTWEGRIRVKELDQLLDSRNRPRQQPIELLILSACQTAKGDKRAALGLAGVAIRSGARSTIATLWSVQDRSTVKLITQFYRALKQPGITRAEALRQAQLSLLKSTEYNHPYYWAPFVLIGNWQ